MDPMHRMHPILFVRAGCRVSPKATGGGSPKRLPPPACVRPNRAYSCAGSGSIVSGSTGTCTSSRKGDVIMTTRIRGKALMKAT